jgi:hypothetical protein
VVVQVLLELLRVGPIQQQLGQAVVHLLLLRLLLNCRSLRVRRTVPVWQEKQVVKVEHKKPQLRLEVETPQVLEQQVVEVQGLLRQSQKVMLRSSSAGCV